MGRAALRAEIIALMLPSVLAGAGLIWLGAVGLGAGLSTAGGWHLPMLVDPETLGDHDGC